MMYLIFLSKLTIIILFIIVTEVNSLETNELYKISWKGPAIFESDNTRKLDDAIRISTSTGEKYMCFTPDSTITESAGLDDNNYCPSKANLSLNETENESDIKNKNPIQLLSPLLKGVSCSYKYELYWTYELCHGKSLRQYHQEITKHQNKITQQFYLGRMEKDDLDKHEQEYLAEEAEYTGKVLSRPTMLIEGVPKPYITINMTDGTVCDLTKKKRSTTLVYACGDGLKPELYSIKETSTCEYEAIILTPHLCKHKDFMQESSQEKEISCFSLDGAPIKPKKVIDPKEEEELAKDQLLDSKRVIHTDSDLEFYLVNLMQA